MRVTLSSTCQLMSTCSMHSVARHLRPVGRHMYHVLRRARKVEVPHLKHINPTPVLIPMRAMSMSSTPRSDEVQHNPIAKAWENRAVYTTWSDANTFDTDCPLYRRVYLFMLSHEQALLKAGLDIPDFLIGARCAFELVMQVLYSPGFFAAVGDPENTSNEEITLLRDVLSTEIYEQFVKTFQEFKSAGVVGYELKNLDVKGCFLYNMALSDDESTVDIQVLCKATEEITTTGLHDEKEIRETTIRDTDCIWTFTSDIRNPDALKWIITGLA
jgi:hypothetical protein